MTLFKTWILVEVLLSIPQHIDLFLANAPSVCKITVTVPWKCENMTMSRRRHTEDILLFHCVSLYMEEIPLPPPDFLCVIGQNCFTYLCLIHCWQGKWNHHKWIGPVRKHTSPLELGPEPPFLLHVSWGKWYLCTWDLLPVLLYCVCTCWSFAWKFHSQLSARKIFILLSKHTLDVTFVGIIMMRNKTT